MRKCKALGLSVLLAAMVLAPAVPAAWADQAASAAQDAAAGLIEVNGIEYPSLAEALGAIPADKPATIKLLGDVAIPDGMKLTITTDVTVVLNGYTLTSNDGETAPSMSSRPAPSPSTAPRRAAPWFWPTLPLTACSKPRWAPM